MNAVGGGEMKRTRMAARKAPSSAESFSAKAAKARAGSLMSDAGKGGAAPAAPGRSIRSSVGKPNMSEEKAAPRAKKSAPRTGRSPVLDMQDSAVAVAETRGAAPIKPSLLKAPVKKDLPAKQLEIAKAEGAAFGGALKGDSPSGEELRTMVVTLRYRAPASLTRVQLDALMELESKSIGVDRSANMERVMDLMKAVEAEAVRSKAATEVMKE